MKRLRRGLRILAIGFGFCVFLLAAYVAVENVRGRILREQITRKLRANHEPLALADLRITAYSAEGNTGPAIIEAAKELDRLGRANPTASQGPKGLMRLDTSGRAVVLHSQPLFPGYPIGQRAGNSKSPGIEWGEVERELANAAAPLSKLREALQQPAASPRVDYNKDFNNDEIFGPWKCTQWLISAGLMDLHARRFDAAADDIATLSHLSAYLRKDRRLIGQNSAYLTDIFTLDLVWDGLQSEGLTDAQLARIQRAISQPHVLDDAMASLELEQARIADRFAQLRQSSQGRSILFRMEGRDLIEDLLGEKEVPRPSELAIQARSALWWAAWSYQDEACALTRWHTFLTAVRLLRDEKSWTAFARRSPKDDSTPRGLALWRNSFSETSNPQSGRALLAKIIRTDTQRGMTLAALAIRRHTLREGTPPAELETLVPDFLPEVPLDLMDGKPLRYRSPAQPGDGKGFTLYSVGLDGVDNGGDATPSQTDKRLGLWAGLDVVWPLATPGK